MKLIRRRKSKTPVQKALDAVRLALRGVVAVRVARNALKTYKFARRLPILIAGGVVAVLVGRKVLGGDDASEPVSYEPPPAAAPRPTSAPGGEASAPTPPPAAPPVEASPPAEASPPVEPSPPEAAPANPATAASAPAPPAPPAPPEPPAASTGGDGAPSPAALSENGGEMPKSPDLGTEPDPEKAG